MIKLILNILLKYNLFKKLSKFLVTEILCTNQGIKTQIYNKAKKLPVHWSSKTPFKYKRNAITGELHRARRIASDFDKETKRIDTQNILLKTLWRILTKKDKLLIPLCLFDERKHVTICLPISSKN